MARPWRKVKVKTPRQVIGTRRLWPHDTLRIREWYDVSDPKKFRSARNSAYQYGDRVGKKFRAIVMYTENGHPFLNVERIK